MYIVRDERTKVSKYENKKKNFSSKDYSIYDHFFDKIVYAI